MTRLPRKGGSPLRLSEKSVELNYCSEATALLPRSSLFPYWCGLTQAQEAKEGIDVAGTLGGKLVVYQFKASNRIVGGLRQFRAPHKQFKQLRKLGQRLGNVFYVFPDIGDVDEYISAGSLLSKTWLCDVSQRSLAKLGKPSRAAGYHLVNLDVSGSKPVARWYSDPVEADLVRADVYYRSLEDPTAESARPGVISENYADLLQDILAVPGRKMLGMVIR